jgi:hypothetical protein
MLVLLAFSTALALLVPEPRTTDESAAPDQVTADRAPAVPTDDADGSGNEQATRNEARPGRKEPSRSKGRTVERTVRAEGPVERISIARGDRLVIEVRSRRPVVVAIGGTGLVDAAGPYDPARFDLLVRGSGDRLFVEDLDSGRKFARIEID